WAVPIGAVAMYLVYTLGVSSAAGIQLRQNPLRIWIAGRRKALVPEVGLYPVGAAMAIGAASFAWTPVLMIVPACVIYMTLRHTFRLQLVKQTPSAVQGEEIPLGAQVIAVADSVDAMTSDRSYRSALTLAETLKELSRGRGSHWAPAVVDAFLAIAKREGEAMVTAIEGSRLAGL